MKIVDLWVEKILNMERTIDDAPAKLKAQILAELAKRNVVTATNETENADESVDAVNESNAEADGETENANA